MNERSECHRRAMGRGGPEGRPWQVRARVAPVEACGQFSPSHPARSENCPKTPELWRVASCPRSLSHPCSSLNPRSGAAQPAAEKQHPTHCPERQTDFTSAAQSGPPSSRRRDTGPQAERAERSAPGPAAPQGLLRTATPSASRWDPRGRTTLVVCSSPSPAPAHLIFMPLAEVILGTQDGNQSAGGEDSKAGQDTLAVTFPHLFWASACPSRKW